MFCFPIVKTSSIKKHIPIFLYYICIETPTHKLLTGFHFPSRIPIDSFQGYNSLFILKRFHLWYVLLKIRTLITVGNPLKNEGNQFIAFNVHTLYFSLDFHRHFICMVVIFLIHMKINNQKSSFIQSIPVNFIWFALKITQVNLFCIQGIIIENFNGENAIIQMNALCPTWFSG